MRHFFLAFLFLSAESLFSQYSSVELSPENAKILGDLSKKATLNVVINNEKDPKDAALVSAVKNYWKAGQYKFMSDKEFNIKKFKNELSPSELYIYEWYDDLVSSLPMGQTDYSAFLNVNRGIFFLSCGKKSNNGLNSNGTISLRFDLSSTIANNKDKIIDGYFDLMVKYFNNEVLFCQNENALKDLKKESKNGIIYFDNGVNDVQSKDILLIKEQVSRNSLKKGAKKISPAGIVSVFGPNIKNVYTVFPEDIKMAVNKNDKQVLLYTNDMLISAKDGKPVAAPDKSAVVQSKKDYPFWFAVLGILASAFTTATLMK